MFEIKLTKETAIANVLRQMMGISKAFENILIFI